MKRYGVKVLRKRSDRGYNIVLATNTTGMFVLLNDEGARVERRCQRVFVARRLAHPPAPLKGGVAYIATAQEYPHKRGVIRIATIQESPLEGGRGVLSNVKANRIWPKVGT